MGRHDELAAVRDGLRRARSGAGSAWVVSGQPGIGKSSFLREVSALGSAEGFEVRQASVGGSIGGPFGPWEGIFREALPGAVAPAPETGGSSSRSAVPPLSTDLTLLNYVERLESAAAERPQLLLLDDFDRADPDSLATVELLARKAPSLRVVLVAAIRESDAPERGPGDPARDDEVWRRLRTEGTVRSLPLGPLGEEACRRLVAHALGGPSAEPRAAERVQRIVRASQGIPFTALELARYAGPDRPIEERGAGPIEMPEVLRDRRARLSAELGALLEVAAVLGPEFEIAPLAWSLELTPRSARLAVRELTEEGWFVPPETAANDRIRFAHELVWRALREEVPPKRARAISGRLAQWWTTHRPNDHGTLGRWLGEAGHRREARRALRLAVRRAVQREEYPSLPIHLAMFRDLSTARPDESRDAAALYLSVIAEIRYGRGQRYLPRLLADLVRLESPAWVPIAAKVWEADLLLRQSPADAAARLATVERQAAQLGDAVPPEVRLRMELVRTLIDQFMSPPDVVLERAEKVLRQMLGKGWAAERCRLRLAIAHSHHVLGDASAGRKIFEQAKRDARHAGPQAAILDLIIEEVRGWAKENAGDLRGSLHQLETMADRYGEAGLLYMRANSLSNLGGMQADIGDLEGAWRNAAEARRLAERLGFRLVEAVAEIVLGEILLDQGWFDEAARRLEEARSTLGGIGARATSLHWLATGLLVRCRAQQGRIEEARSDFAELEARAGEPAQYYGPLLELYRAWLREGSGEPEEALRSATNAWTLSEESHQPRLRLEIIAFLLRWDLVHGQESRARFRTCELRNLCALHGVDPVPLLRTIERSARIPFVRADGANAAAGAVAAP